MRGERRALPPWWSEKLRTLPGKQKMMEKITLDAQSSALRTPWQPRRLSKRNAKNLDPKKSSMIPTS